MDCDISPGFYSAKMNTSADLISNVMMDCTGFTEKCKRTLFTKSQTLFSQAIYDLLHLPVTFPHLSMLSL